MAVSSKNAILNVGRLNAFRLDFVELALRRLRDAKLTITLNGAPLKVRRGSLDVHDVINDAPNTATLVVDDATPPTVGGRLKVVFGVDPKYTFTGTLQAARQSYVGRAHADAWACEAIDDTARADWLRPFGAWENVSASTVAQQIVASFMPGFSSAAVQAGLPAVTVYLDGTERVNGALRLLAKLIGGYYYFDDYVLHLFTGDEPGANPDDVTGAPGGQLLEDPRLEAASDDSQIRTRCYGKGHSEPTLSAVTAGDTKIPIANAVMFTAGGGKAISEWQRLTYTGTVIGGDGALVGPGVTPSAAPVAAITDGSGIEAGAHNYAYTWVTAAGETMPSPIAAVTLTGGQVAAPTFSVSSGIQPGGPPAGLYITYQMLIVSSGGNGLYSVGSVVLGITSTGNRPVLNFVTTADMRGRAIEFYRNDNNGTGWSPVPIMGGPVGSSWTNPYPPSQPAGYGQQWTDQLVSYGGGFVTAPPGPNYMGPLTGNRVALSGVSTGPAGVTARKVYRTAANLTPLKLLTTLANNTATTYADAQADATLGATAPATDSSGLTMPAGQVLPGAAAMSVSGTGWALPAGGWAIIGNGQQIIRYTGISGNQITGIPATGAGAITAAVNYNSTVTGAPMLIGVGGLGTALILGAPVNIWVQVDDTAAQAALAARVGGSGIVEQLIIDERRGEPSLLALCNADLALYGRPIVTIRYTTFDLNSRAGRPVRVHLAQPAIDQTLTIQDVTIATSDGTGPPRLTVTASSIRTSLEDLLRRMVGTLEEGF
ncbi:MAG TPA: hypothetical protein VN903_29910 [Polyangia bacterium]|nr:hypothetical protein [Polyangia bacterium]